MKRIIFGVGLLFWCAVAIVMAGQAKAETQPLVVVNHHGVLKSTSLRDCRVASSVPCSLFDGIDSGWLDEDYTWHSVWMHGPRHGWKWATRAERQQYKLTPMNQVKRVRGHVVVFRGPTGETWCNCPGYDSEHWPS